MKKYTHEQVQALVEAADCLLTDAIDRGDVHPDCETEEDFDMYPHDEDGEPWYSDYFELFQALKPFLENK